MAGYCRRSGNGRRRRKKSRKSSGRYGAGGFDAARGTPCFLRRVLRYGEKVFGVCTALGNMKDERIRPRIPGGRVALAYLMLMLTRLGSLNALEQRKSSRIWQKWLGGLLPSADVMGRVACTARLDALRAVLGRQHARLKRNKGFGPDPNGLRWLVLDGHEGASSYRRSWKDCLKRVVRFATGDRTQFYFRYVAAYLTNGERHILLDAERQLPGEGETPCAIRLLRRILENHPRAFDAVSGDNAYMCPELWQLVRAHRKHLVAVLKNEDRDLLADARSLFAQQQPLRFDDARTRRLCWDLDGFTTWPQCGEPVRVVRSVETSGVKRQSNGETELLETQWFWVTSLPPEMASTSAIVQAGHKRWDIENHGFNELCTFWHGDHAYKYDAHAMLVCTLLLFIAFNLFNAFIERNLKPEVRIGRTAKYWAELITAEFHILFHPRPAPT